MSLAPHRLTTVFFPKQTLLLQRQTAVTPRFLPYYCSAPVRLVRSKPHHHHHHPQHATHNHFQQLQSSLSLATLVLAGTGSFILAWALDPFAELNQPEAPSEETEDNDSAAAFAIMPDTRQGWLGNLTPQQEQALKELWERLGKITHIIPPERASTDSSLDSESPSVSRSPSIKSTKKKKRFSLLRRSGGEDDDAPVEPEDKHGQEKDFKQALADQTPEELRKNIWSFCKGDNPDALLLRFLRARKWDVHNALVMLVSTAHWRGQIKLDDEVMPRGEAYYVDQAANGTGAAKKLGEEFIFQMRKGKSFVHGVDREGRPLCYVRVRLHHASDQSEEAIEKFTVYTIETTRMMLRDPVDTAGVVFDMTGFSMANMDYTPVKFMIKVFEANYPESLGHICVHRAPWIFNTIWGIIKGWLDPVVASKISFTKDEKELEAYIPPENIPKELGGRDDWEYAYVEPVARENERLATAASNPEYLAAKAERQSLVEQFEQLTLQWVRSEGGAEVAARRAAVGTEMQANYWRLDPFVRAPSLYDRTGVIARGGRIDMYPERSAAKGASLDGAPNGAPSPAAASHPIATSAAVGAGAGMAGAESTNQSAALRVADADDGASLRQSFETARESWE